MTIHTMRTMGAHGDVKLMWDSDNADEVANARRTFTDLQAKGFAAFDVDTKGKPAGQVRRFESGRWYEIERGHHANVFGLGARGKRTETLCVYPTGAVPEADAMLAQKLYLEANEERLRQVAHITPLP